MEYPRGACPGVWQGLGVHCSCSLVKMWRPHCNVQSMGQKTGGDIVAMGTAVLRAGRNSQVGAVHVGWGGPRTLASAT